MRKLTATLGIILALQIVLVFAVNFWSQRRVAGGPEPSLVGASLAQADSITIEEKGKSPFLLSKKGDRFVIPSLFDYPASTTTVDKVIHAFQDFKGGWPVATTSDARQRFHVDAADFEKKVTFKKGSKVLAELFLGTAPSYRKQHVRLADKSEIYVMTIDPFDTSARAEDWLDRDFYSVDAEKASALTIAQFSLEKIKDKWMLVEDGKPVEIAQPLAITAFNKAAGIKVSAVEGVEAPPYIKPDSPALSVGIKLTAGGNRDYKIFNGDKPDYYILKSAADSFYVRIDSFYVKELTSLKKEDLKKTAPKPPDPKEVRAPAKP